MVQADMEKAIFHLRAALAALEGAPKKRSRNPEWFRETGHLTDRGIEYLHSQFAKGRSSYAIAKEMMLSYRAVSLRHDDWRKKNPTPAPWMRQDGK
jgi:hypothetical protein